MSVIPWTYSKLETYQICPRQFYAKYVAKTAIEEESDNLIWGKEVHKALELRLTDGLSLPHTMTQWEPLARQLEARPGEKYCELKLAVNEKLEPVEFFDNNAAWNRGVEDIVIVDGNAALTGDYKTGKKKPKSKQLQLSAVRVFSKFPQVEKIVTGFFWLPLFPNPGWITRETFYRKDVVSIVETFKGEIKDLLWSDQNNAWPAKPNGLCKAWCPDLTCPHNGKRRR